MSKYVGKNIRLSGDKVYYVNSFGQARLYPDKTTLESKGPNCSKDYIDVGSTTLPELGLVKGENMYKHEPCGYDGKIVQIGEKAISKVNLCRIGNAIASQSSTYHSSHTGLDYPASNAINGITDGSTFQNTNGGVGQYWQVQLGQNSLISHLVIYNRRHHENRFTTVKLEIFDENDEVVYDYTIKRTKYEQDLFVVNNINKVGRTVRLTQLEDTYLHVAEVEVYGSYEQGIGNGKMGYVTGDGILRPYLKNDTTNNTGTCPNMTPMPISENTWNSFKKGNSMTESTQCEFGNIDSSQKHQLADVNSQLLKVADTIYQKIEAIEKTISALRAQEGYESDYFNNQLTRFKGLFNKYNHLNYKITNYI